MKDWFSYLFVPPSVSCRLYLPHGHGGMEVSAMDPTPPKYYHTRLDDYDLLEPEVIQVGAEITMEAVCLFAENGLPEL